MSGVLRLAGGFAVVLCILQIGVPLVLFFLQIRDPIQLWESLGLCWEELLLSIGIAMLSAGTAVDRKSVV